MTKVDPALAPGDFVECSVTFDEREPWTHALIATKVDRVSSFDKNGCLLKSSYIGSDDPEILHQFPSGTVLTLHFCALQSRQNEISFDADECIHAQRQQRHSLNSFRAMSYLSADVLQEYAPAPLSTKAASLRSAISSVPQGQRMLGSSPQTPKSDDGKVFKKIKVKKKPEAGMFEKFNRLAEDSCNESPN